MSPTRVRVRVRVTGRGREEEGMRIHCGIQRSFESPLLVLLFLLLLLLLPLLTCAKLPLLLATP